MSGLVDGSASTWRRAHQPAWLQTDGSPPTLAPPSETNRSPVLLVSGLTAAALSGGLYAGAWQQRLRYDDLVSSGGADAERIRTHSTTNGLSIGAVVGAAASAGLLVLHVRQ